MVFAFGAATGICVVQHQVYRLVGALLGAHALKLVGHCHVVAGGEVEGHVHALEGSCDRQPDIEIHKA